MEFDNQVAVVTGAGRGIGQATALRLAAEGAAVVINDLDPRECAATAATIIDAGGRAVAVAGDVTSPTTPAELVEAAMDSFGSIDLLVNNAGWVEVAAIRDIDAERWARMLDINLNGAFRMLQVVGAQFVTQHRAERDSGPVRQRKIVNVSSRAGVRGIEGSIHYATAKAGIIGMTKSAAREWGRYGINVNAAAFGMIATRLTTGDVTDDGPSELAINAENRDRYSAAGQAVPLRRPGTVEEAAGVLRFLCSKDANYVSGHILMCTGGD